ncbi:PREDICTED: S-phase kinase-associated protein 2 isoform X2 [Nicrophorus vespilloides]|uniref:S-phase kinase-associated protein 2 isoform X2 n=1 Tax=Nicrophorus vespilloides TaxID=110193 RepID=A0ABM1MIW8_NICVS|nr:PREDICTED: S-phase kinase-associated protein 2 isoform X2 [Nicrophorus vespilloides]
MLCMKRARYDSPVKEGWSLTSHNLKLDEVFDFGVGVLNSDSETQTDDEECPRDASSYDDCLEPTAEPDEPAADSISLDDWDGFLIKKPVISNTSIDQFCRLSDEVILHIFHFLPKRQLTQIACVSKRFHRLTEDESLWARMDVSNRVLYPGALGQILSRQVVILRLAQSEISHPAIMPDCRASNEDFQSRLLYLDLSLVHVSPESLTSLFTKCQRLKKLSLEHVQINTEVLQALAQNKELEVLNLAMVQGIEVDGLKVLLKNCKKLRELNLAWTFLSCPSIKLLCAQLPKTLDRLNISGCRKLLTDNYVLDLVKSCPGLRELDLSDCTGLTGTAIHHIILLEDLNFLALSRCYLIPYRSLLTLKKVKSLVYLDVHGGYIDYTELRIIQDGLGSHIHINKFKFSSVARPTVGARRSSIWNMRVRD